MTRSWCERNMNGCNVVDHPGVEAAIAQSLVVSCCQDILTKLFDPCLNRAVHSSVS